MQITIKPLTHDTVTPTLQRLMRVAKNPAPVTRAIADRMLREVQDNILAQGRPRWTPLSKATLKSRAKRGKGNQMLRDRGYLYTSLSRSYGSDYARVSSNMPYARIQHEGGTIDFAPRSGTVRLRTDRKGNLLRQKGHPNLARFANRRHKRVAVKRWTAASGWSVTIPAPSGTSHPKTKRRKNSAFLFSVNDETRYEINGFPFPNFIYSSTPFQARLSVLRHYPRLSDDRLCHLSI
ncbi:MAG: phage virion morphogenesis protein [Burkholderiales bacterium]|jgi:phage virion morphogenesis protein|nr:phage virion morphogenesis protein [Burkholderiales bacterium]